MNAAENRIDWAKLLNEALTEPGRIHEAYSRFSGYSLGNRIWALMQCSLRGISPGPLASFNRWKQLGRHIKKGERAIACVCRLRASGRAPRRTRRPKRPRISGS